MRPSTAPTAADAHTVVADEIFWPQRQRLATARCRSPPSAASHRAPRRQLHEPAGPETRRLGIPSRPGTRRSASKSVKLTGAPG